MAIGEAHRVPRHRPPRPNYLDWPDCLNVRDLGGQPTVDGGTIRPGALIRSDHHAALTDEGIGAVRAAEVSRIIDLRRATECEKEPSPFAGTPLYHHVPVQDPADPDDNVGFTLAQIYCRLLDRRPSLFAAAVASIADAPPGAVVVQCAGGKDRTGMVVAMALMIAGVDAEAIADDYALTEERLRTRSTAQIAAITDPERREWIRPLHRTLPATMLETLEHLDSRYGGVAAFLDTYGCPERTQAIIRQRLRA